MPVVLKLDGSLVEPLEDSLLEVCLPIRKSDPDVNVGSSAFVWSHYSSPKEMDGQLIALGVVVRADRSDDKKTVDLGIALSERPPLRNWLSKDLDRFKNSGGNSVETEIADEVRGYTLEHVGHVSSGAASLMASYFI